MAIELAILPVASAENISTNIAPSFAWEVGSAVTTTPDAAQALFTEEDIALAARDVVVMAIALNMNGTESVDATIVQPAVFEGVDSPVAAGIEVARLTGAHSIVDVSLAGCAEINNIGDMAGAYNGIIGTPIREIPAATNVIRHEAAAFAGALGVVA